MIGGGAVTCKRGWCDAGASAAALGVAAVRRPPLAEDLVQETLAKVYVRFDRLDNPAAYARTLGLSAGAVRNRSMRALARMRERSLS